MRWLAGILVSTVLAGFAFIVISSPEAPPPPTSPPQEASGGDAGLSLAPVRTVLDPDQTRSAVDYVVTNTSPAPQTYAVRVLELDPDGRKMPDSPGGADAWVSLESREVTVAAGESTTVTAMVEPPPDRGADQRRIGVAFTPAARGDGAGQVALRTEIVTSIYVPGAGTSRYEVQLSDLQVPRVSGGRFTARATVVNRGTVTVIPGSAQTPVIGTAGSGRFTLGADPVWAGTEGVATGTVDDLPLVCWCHVEVTISDGQGGTSSVHSRVLVAPPWLGALAAVMLLLAAWLLIRPDRRSKSPDDREVTT